MDEQSLRFGFLLRYMQEHPLATLSTPELSNVLGEIRNLQAVYALDSPECYGVLRTFVQKFTDEFLRRELLPTSYFVGFDDKGNFVVGREELEYLFDHIEFEQMLQVIDVILPKCANQKQREALIQVAYDKELKSK